MDLLRGILYRYPMEGILRITAVDLERLKQKLGCDLHQGCLTRYILDLGMDKRDRAISWSISNQQACQPFPILQVLADVSLRARGEC